MDYLYFARKEPLKAKKKCSVLCLLGINSRSTVDREDPMVVRVFTHSQHVKSRLPFLTDQPSSMCSCAWKSAIAPDAKMTDCGF